MADDFMVSVMEAVESGLQDVSSVSVDVSCVFRTAEEFRQDDYRIYGVDNEFDLLVAIYDDYAQGTCDIVRDPLFVERRIQCAMNPEYTEKCLSSYAFADVRDDILTRLGDIVAW